jgi:hypothetical protein
MARRAPRAPSAPSGRVSLTWSHGRVGTLRRSCPRDEAAQREHFKEVDEDLRRDQEADRVVKDNSTRRG